jgi:ribosomal protein L40E
VKVKEDNKMICKNCGEENKDEARFCKKCGTPLGEEKTKEADVPQDKLEAEQPNVSAEPVRPQAVSGQQKDTKPKHTKIVLAIAAVIVVVIVAFAFGKKLQAGNSGTYIKNPIVTYYDVDNEENLAFINGKQISGSMEGRLQSTLRSLDGKTVMYETYDGNDYMYYVTTGNNITLVTDESKGAWLSDNGAYIAYIDEDETLYLYQVSNGSRKKIADDINGTYVAMSPNGKSIAYCRYDDEELRAYAYIEGKEYDLGKNLIVQVISDGGEYMYALFNKDGDIYGGSSSLYMVNKKGEKGDKIASALDCIDYVNKEHTEIIFYSDGKTYISIKGGEKQKLSSDHLSSGTYNKIVRNLSITTGSIYIVDTAHLLPGYYSGQYINAKYENEKIVPDDARSIKTDGNNTFYYIKSDNLYRVKSDKNAEREKIASDVAAYAVSQDGKYIYYINTDEELYCIKGNADAKKIAEDVDELRVSKDGAAFFLVDYADHEGELYACINGKDKQKVASEVYRIIVSGDNVYYRINYDEKDETFDVYIRTGGVQFTPMVSGVRY